MARSVLVAEDESHLAEALTFLMARAGFEVSAVGDGPAVLAMIRRQRPDLVLLDLMLPGCDGFDVLEAIKADARTRDTRIIVLTAKGREQDKQRARALGVDGYVTKPFSNSEVVELVRTLLSSPED